MVDPKKKRYFYAMLAGFGTIGLSIVLFFILYNAAQIYSVFSKISDILAPFIYGSVVAYLLRPMCNAFEDYLQVHLPSKLRKLSSVISIAASLCVLLLIIYTLINMIAPRLAQSVVNLWNAMPQRYQVFLDWAQKTFGANEQLVQTFTNIVSTITNDLRKWAESSEIAQQSSGILSGTGIMNGVGSFVSGVGTGVYKLLKILYNFLIGLIVAVYLLSSRKQFARQGTLIVRSLFPEKWANMVLEEIAFIDRMFGGFIDAKILDSAIVGVICYIGCSVFKFPNALLVSVFVGVTNIIPFFGPFIGAVPSTLLILMESPVKALWFVLFVLVLQQLDGNVIGPRIMGNRTGLSGFWVMFAIVFFGGLWGIVGMAICVPVFAVIYDTIKKLVKRGLRNKGKYELWEQYIADYPNDDLPK